MPALFALPQAVPLSSLGAILPGSKLYFFATGTTNPQNVYTDVNLSVAHSHPVVADAAGVFDPIYLDGSLANYRVRLTDSSDVQLWQIDDVPASQNQVQTLRLKHTTPEIILEETDGAANNKKIRIRLASERLLIQLLNDAESSATNIAEIDRTLNVCDTINLLATNVQANSENVTAARFAYKSSSTDRSSTTTLADDPDLQLTLQAGASYRVDVFLLFTGVTTGTQGIKYAHAYSGSLTTTGLGQGISTINSTPAARVPFTVFATNTVATIATGGSSDGLWHSFFVRTDTLGTLSVQWAQNSSDANATRMVTGSFMQATRLG